MDPDDDPEFDVYPEFDPPRMVFDTHLNGNFKRLEQAFDNAEWMIALSVLRALVEYVHTQLDSSGFVVDTMAGGYNIHTVDYRFAIPFRWATDVLEYAQELVEMGYMPEDASIFDKLMARVHSEATAYNEWLDEQADRFTS